MDSHLPKAQHESAELAAFLQSEGSEMFAVGRPKPISALRGTIEPGFWKELPVPSALLASRTTQHASVQQCQDTLKCFDE